MFNIFKKFQYIIANIEVISFEIEESQIRIQIKLELKDNSLLVIRDYKFSDNSRKYVYHWMDKSRKLRVRWDNAAHWKDIDTFPHHKHFLNEEDIRESMETDIESVLIYIKDHIE